MWSIVQYKKIGKGIASERNPQLASRKSCGNGDGSRTASPCSRVPETSSRNSDPEQRGSDGANPEKTNESGKFYVTLDSENDPLNPRDWPLLQRAKTVLILSMLVFVQAWAGACDSLENAKASKQYHVSPVAQDLTTAMYLFGIGSGCLFVGPLSQDLGRNPVYLGFSFVYLLFTFGNAMSKSFGSQIVCRYFAGIASSAALGINGASMGDMFNPVELTLWFPLMAWVNVVPPVLSPIVGGWVASRDDLDWIWTNWITLMISGFAFLIALFFLPETNVNVLLSFKAKQLRHITGDNRYTTQHGQSSGLVGRLLKVLPSSIQFLVSEPAILSLGTFLVLLYVLLFTFLSGFEYIFKRRYNLTPLEEGACFASIALGSTAFSLAGPGLYVWTRHSVSYNENAPIVPESRLWPAMVAAPLLPISLFWLGWTDYADISVYSGLSACFCFGIVLNAMYVSSYEYIIDSYGEKAALGLAGVTMMRYIVAGGMVIAARPMYEKIGVHWTMTLLGCVALVLVPAPYVLFKRGTELRRKSPHASNVSSGNKEET